MIHIFVLFLYLFWLIALVGIGSIMKIVCRLKILNKHFNIPNDIKIATYGISGFVILSVIGAVSNFFIPLNHIFSLSMLVVGLVLFALNRKDILLWLDGFDISIIIFLLILCSVFPFLTCEIYDTCLYHIQSIKWITESTVPFGLTNLHGRLGFNSSWFIVSAILEPLRIATKRPFFIINALILFFYGSAILLKSKNLSLKNISLSSLFLTFTFVPWFIKLNYCISSPAPDLPVMLISFFIIYLLIYMLENFGKADMFLFLSLIFSVFIITLKLSSVIYAIGLFLLIAYFFFSRIKNQKIGFSSVKGANLLYVLSVLLVSSLIIIPWIVKGLISSGCLAYPSKLGYFPSLKWAVPISQINSQADAIRSWARNPLLQPEQVLSNWEWFTPWLKKFIVHELFIIILVFFGTVMILSSIFRKKGEVFKTFFLIPLLLSLGGIVFWFVSAPNPRFGYGYLFPFALLLFSHGVLTSGFIEIIPEKIEKNKGVIKIFLLVIGSGLVLFGAFVYIMSFSSSMIFNMGEFLGAEAISFNFWSHHFKLYGILFFVAGSLICFYICLRKWLLKEKSSLLKNPLMIIYVLLILFVNNIFVYHNEIVQTSNIPEIEIIPKKTKQGIVIYTPKNKDEDRTCDAPLPSTPYFNPDIKIKFSEDGKLVMFWYPKTSN